MRGESRAKIGFIIAAIAMAALLLFLFPITIRTVRTYICDNTGSRMGYHEWFFGATTAKWYETSALEIFMREKFPDKLQHRWIASEGTGRDIFGRAVSRRHGSPGPIFDIGVDHLNEWIATRPDADKKAFYDLLVSADEKAIREKINSIMDDLFELRSK